MPPKPPAPGASEPPKATPRNSDRPLLKVKRLRMNAVMPERKTDGAAGFDLVVLDNIVIEAQQLAAEAYKLHTGLALEVPEGYVAKIYLRSSTGANTKLRLANGTGIIDSDYRGEVVLLVENIGRYSYFLEPGARLAQLILDRVVEFDIEEAQQLSETKRGAGGVGSTGK